jgi:hypothetical protein
MHFSYCCIFAQFTVLILVNKMNRIFLKIQLTWKVVILKPKIIFCQNSLSWRHWQIEGQTVKQNVSNVTNVTNVTNATNVTNVTNVTNCLTKRFNYKRIDQVSFLNENEEGLNNKLTFKVLSRNLFWLIEIEIKQFLV